jgi:GWxTD domain-containing protein
MKAPARFLATFLLPLACSLAANAQTLPELFQKAKAQVKGESWQNALKTLDALDAEAAKPGNEAAREQLAAPTAFYRGVCQANLGNDAAAKEQFSAFLKFQPNANLDPSMYSKKTLAAFDEARKAVAPVDTPASNTSASIFTAYQEFKAPPNIGEPPSDHWGDGPVKWIMTPDEKREWASLASASERAEFVQKFWASRNPRPGTDDNTFQTTFERRVAFADTYFPQDEKQRGSMTDRGMVFVLLGPPTYVGRKPIRTGDDTSEAAGLSTVGSQDASTATRSAAAASPSGKLSSGQRAVIQDAFTGPGTKALDSASNWREVWHYRKELLPKAVPYLQVDVEFITKKGYGMNILQRDHTTLTTLDKARQPPAAAQAAAKP